MLSSLFCNLEQQIEVERVNFGAQSINLELVSPTKCK